MHERNRPARVSDDLPPIGFWSYSREDDRRARGRLSQLRALLAEELENYYGRNSGVRLFQDVAALEFGDLWEQEIADALGQCSFMIPILTPDFLQSQWCCHEVREFQKREATLGRKGLIFPIHYVDTKRINPNDPRQVHDREVWDRMRATQRVEFDHLRLYPPETSIDVQLLVQVLARQIEAALRGEVIPETPAPPPPIGPTPTLPAIITRPAPPKPGTIHQDAPDLPEMVLLDKGTYLRGIPHEESTREKSEDADTRSRPVRPVTIPTPFWLARAPVTRGQFATFVRDTDRTMPTEAWTFEPNDKGAWAYGKRPNRDWRNPGFEQTDRHPVVCVNHDDALAYIEWLNQRTQGGYRLPSESEWEYAARAGTTTARFWGDGPTGACKYANVADHALMRRTGREFAPARFFDCDDGFPFTALVGSFQPNPFDLHDMLGNVSEWCADHWHDTYEGCPTDGSAWTFGGDKDRRVLRGGSWVDLPRAIRAGIRNAGSDSGRHGFVGFRPARTLFPPGS